MAPAEVPSQEPDIFFILFGSAAVITLLGAFILIRERPEASATFTSLAVTVLSMVAVAGGLSVVIGKQG
ncbi:hypothetical protein [Rathayibacter sp. AY1A3]|uniref:hypothetical protein n=1 Tax=Rathayibacter sp. AY1A3 TaxID=2080521 RepID=UPI0011B071AB|nr:hypothetical protein [Rathayibacter sp. AY1A3]